jgi:hypothetical protein
MKTRADLLLRDALAALFVSACAGDARAQKAVEALDAWAKDEAVSPERRADLAALQAENGRPIFAPHGQLAAEFGALIPYVQDRARRFTAAIGWLGAEGGVGDPLRAARAAWDAGLFFEVHELLEPEWLRSDGARKTTLQGLILAGAGLHHLVGANRAGALGLLRDAARKLAESPRLEGFDLSAFGQGMSELAEQIAAGTVKSAAEVRDLPRF